jgi:hypothetical protein
MFLNRNFPVVKAPNVLLLRRNIAWSFLKSVIMIIESCQKFCKLKNNWLSDWLQILGSERRRSVQNGNSLAYS